MTCPQPFTVFASRSGAATVRITMLGISRERVLLTARELFPSHTITATPDGQWEDGQ
jgi:hypothetical protein